MERGDYVLAPPDAYIHVPAFFIEQKAPQRLRKMLARLKDPQVKLACVNNLRVASERLPRTMEILRGAIRFP
ncbi:hypothetical protein [Sulfitobacter sp. S190]|uniref:hypothetical protein n=1 Tax=Sulfitobacter sp. S190 TaxID=2867022 RepID=UPI0021A28BC3|nr:hypothetical protein [Sulfitobacter sp. S190]UWR22227.1 hypothetical protein K3756_16390 [Sulfitobacter sp. S190]